MLNDYSNRFNLTVKVWMMKWMNAVSTCDSLTSKIKDKLEDRTKVYIAIQHTTRLL